ncbi:hypothetical protein TNCV_2488181 [Trichonephila clavipes]|nr:hypothetical protein TNCV_2488181 [Trichonephila clavipes]
MKFSEGRKSFEMSTKCSSEAGHAYSHSRVPRAHQARLSRRSLASFGLSESVLWHGHGLELLTNGGVHQQQHLKLTNRGRNKIIQCMPLSSEELSLWSPISGSGSFGMVNGKAVTQSFGMVNKWAGAVSSRMFNSKAGRGSYRVTDVLATEMFYSCSSMTTPA